MEVTESVRKAATVWRNSKETATHMSQHGTKEMRIDIWREEFLRSQKQSLLSNTLSSSLKDLCCDMDFEVASERYVQSDSGVSSVVSSTCTNPYTSADSVGERLRSVRPAVLNTAEKKRLGYACRSTSQESNTSQQTASSVAASIDLFRLPPILTPLLTDEKVPHENSGSQASVCGVQCDKLKRSDSLSSVEPNVDSSLSSLPSDSSSSGSNNNISSSSEHSESESSDELASPQEAVEGITKPLRNVKSATHYRKNVPRRAQTRAATGRVQQKPSVHQGRVREQGVYIG